MVAYPTHASSSGGKTKSVHKDHGKTQFKLILGTLDICLGTMRHTSPLVSGMFSFWNVVLEYMNSKSLPDILQTTFSEECYVRMNVLFVETKALSISHTISMIRLAIKPVENHLSAHSVVDTIESSCAENR